MPTQCCKCVRMIVVLGAEKFAADELDSVEIWILFQTIKRLAKGQILFIDMAFAPSRVMPSSTPLLGFRYRFTLESLPACSQNFTVLQNICSAARIA